MSTRPDRAAGVRRRRGSRAELLAEVARELRGYQSALDAFDEAVAERLGINRTDLRCLDLLSQHKRLTAGALARASGLTTGAVTFVLDRLERRGLVRRAARSGRPPCRAGRARARGRGARLRAPRAARRGLPSCCPAISRNPSSRSSGTFSRLARELYERHAPLVREAAEPPPADGSAVRAIINE